MITSRERFFSPRWKLGATLADGGDHWRLVLAWAYKRRAWNWTKKAKA